MAGGGRCDYPRDGPHDREQDGDVRLRAPDDGGEVAQVLRVRQGDHRKYVGDFAMDASCGNVFHARRLFFGAAPRGGKSDEVSRFRVCDRIGVRVIRCHAGLAQNAPANGANPKMTPKLAEMLMMGAMGMPGHMGAMSLHMAWSHTRPETDADRKRAEQIAETLKKSLAKYQDYHVAEEAGYKPFHPELKQKMVHFTRNWYAIKAAFTFNPTEPTSLLYRPTPGGGYELIGAMYTAPRRMSEEKLDERVPLSVARWHRHVNLCFPPKDQMATADWTKFGFIGKIATKEACDASGGRFFPVIFGWMVHVYPWESDQARIWAH